MEEIEIIIGEERFPAHFQAGWAPETCSRFQGMLPWERKLIHARWSGEACWIPLGDLDLQLAVESPTHTAEPGQLLFYPKGQSETEILLVYGSSRFACRDGSLCGSPFLRIYNRLDVLAEIGERVLWQGASPIRFSACPITAKSLQCLQQNSEK